MQSFIALAFIIAEILGEKQGPSHPMRNRVNKLNHYCVRGIPNNWFSSHLKNRKQFVSSKGFNSDLKNTK